MDNPTLKPLVFLQETKKNISKLPLPPWLLKPDILSIVFFVFGILTARAELLGSLRPFGGAFFAALFSRRYSYIYIAAAVLGQLLSGAALYECGKYIFAMTLFALVLDRLPKKLQKLSFARGGIFALSLVLSGLFFMFAASRGFSYTTVYDLISLGVECVVSFFAVIAFHKAIPIICAMKLSYSFSSTEEISLVALFGCVLWGSSDITDIGVINLSNIVCILIVLIFAIRLGSSRGAVAGLTMGLVSALGSGRIDASCVSYGLSALAAGLLGSFGAIPACSAFILSNALVTLLANGSTEVLINIYDIFLACLIYSIIPEKFLLRLTSFGTRDEKERLLKDERCYSEHVMLSALSGIKALAKRMDTLHKRRENKTETDLKFFERITRRACAGCGMRRHCWSREVTKTASALASLLQQHINDGKLPDELLPGVCLRPKELKEAFMQASELYRLDMIWQGKISEMRQASLSQMDAFSHILTASIKNLTHHQSFDRALADDIERRLKEAAIPAGEVTVLRDEDRDPTVMLSLSGCGGFSMCENGVADIINAACGKPMVRAGKRDCKSCRVKYVAAPGGRAVFAASRKSRDKTSPSGDSVLFRVINKSLYAAVLCDGMGYGEKAACEARGAAETILDLIEIGVDGEDAMKIVNSLFIPFGEATFAAADLCLYDAASRKARIIKCGGAASFTKSGERVDTLYSKSLPLGSHIKNEVETFTLSAKSGDIIVMISDGVLDSTHGDAKNSWLINEIQKFKGDDPMRLAEHIADVAMNKCNKVPRDDMTVLAAYID